MSSSSRGAPGREAPAQGVVLLDSVTRILPEHVGAVCVSASHGGLSSAHFVAISGLRACLFNDAGLGRDDAGVSGLAYLGGLGIAAAATAHDSARIGDAADAWRRGRVSRANGVAAAAGVRSGQSCREAAERLRSAPLARPEGLASPKERRERLFARGGVDVLLLDSISLTVPEDRGAIILTGSHGGGPPEYALRVEAMAAVYNDAGVGIDEAGVARLPVLQARGIPGATVSAASARIGDARSTYEDGVISRLNEAAIGRGGAVGMPAREFVDRLLRGA